MTPKSTRREILSHSISAASAAVVLAKGNPMMAVEPQRATRPHSEPFGYCFNTATIRGQKLDLAAEIDIVARAGYQGIEPWASEIEHHVQQGGTLGDLKKRIADQGLTVESVIGFAEWIVDDDARRAGGLEAAKRMMDMTVEIGGSRVAAPPAGVSDQDRIDLPTIARRYRTLLELGHQHGCVAQLELWGFSRVLSKLGEVAYAAIEAAHPEACILADSYHLHKGGSDIASLRLLSGQAMHVFHINDYPATPARKEITDAHRVFPGEGVAPLSTLFTTLRDIGFSGMLSLEVFNRNYWNQDALLVARGGLEKTRAAVHKAFS